MDHKPQHGMMSADLCDLLLVWYSMFRSLGFTPDEIYLSHERAADGRLCWGLRLRVEGLPDFAVRVGSPRGDFGGFIERWQRYVSAESQHVPESRLRELRERLGGVPTLLKLAIRLAEHGVPPR